MNFTKMHGCGNDYIYVNAFTETVEDPSAAAIRLSDRHFGIGGDGAALKGAGGYFIARQALKPIKNLTEAANAISDGHDLKARIGMPI